MSNTSEIEFLTETVDTILGTPSSQRILRLLFCWERLPTKEIILKSKLSESQVYNTLRKLESIDLIESTSRGFFRYKTNQFSLKLKDAYIAQLIQLVGKELYKLSGDLDKSSFEVLDKHFTNLVELWEPILDSHFPLKTSSIAGHILDRA